MKFSKLFLNSIKPQLNTNKFNKLNKFFLNKIRTKFNKFTKLFLNKIIIIIIHNKSKLIKKSKPLSTN